MTATEIISEIVNTFVAGITAYGQGIGQGINSIVTAMMFTGSGETQKLSAYFIMVLVFASLAICIGLTTLVFNWLGNMGK